MRRDISSIIVATGLIAALTAPASAQRLAPPATQPATQGGSLPLSEVLALAKAYPNLITEIRLRLLAAGKKKDDVTCTAQRLSSDWPALGGRRTAPYVCPIGKRLLTITATPSFVDRNGYRLAADDPALATKAARLTENRLKWTWK